MPEVMTKGPAQMEGSVVPIRDGPPQVEVDAIDALLGAMGIRPNKEEPQLEDPPTDDALAPGSVGSPYRGLVVSDPGSTLPGDAAPGDSTLAPRSSDIVDLGAIELRLPSYPSMLSTPANWR
jgi:hypothetical protein